MPALDLILAELAIPLLALRVVVSAREIRENLGFITLVIGATMAAYVAVARFNVEFPSIVGGVCDSPPPCGSRGAGSALRPVRPRRAGK